MFQSKIFASGKWTSGTHDEERSEGGLLYLKMASIQEEVEEEAARTPPSPSSPPPATKAADAWYTRRKYGCVDFDARRTKDLLQEATGIQLSDMSQEDSSSHAACSLGSTGLVLRATAAADQAVSDVSVLRRPGSGSVRDYALFVQTMEERSGFGWTSESQLIENFPPHYLERQDSGLSNISTISELAEDLEDLDELSDDEEEEEDNRKRSKPEKEGPAATGAVVEKSRKKISFWDGQDPARTDLATVSLFVVISIYVQYVAHTGQCGHMYCTIENIVLSIPGGGGKKSQ